MAINVLHNNGECVNKEIKAEKMVFERYDEKKNIYIFTKNKLLKKVC